MIRRAMQGGASEGEIIRGYRLDRLIAEGGMGAVWAATHTTLGRRAAVKLLAPSLASNREYVSRFLSEARIVNDVRHPNIVDIFDFVELEGPRVACVMELLEGPTLAERLRRGPLAPPGALQVSLQLVDALVQVHAAGVVHRDLKPQNIVVVAPLHEVPAVKILDFGIAKQGPARTAHKTATGSILGTPAYMAPEQVAATPVSGATDLYALAEMLYEMLSGQRLYRGDNLAILRQKMTSESPQLDLPISVPDSDRIAALLRACLCPEPEARPGLEDFGHAIQSLLDEWGEATPQDRTLATLPDALDGALPTDPDPAAPSARSPAPLTGLPEEPPANTQMFLDRILEDIEEAGPAEPEPEPQPEPAPPPDLELGAPAPRVEYGVGGPTPTAVRTDLRLMQAQHAPPIPIVRGEKTPTKARWWPLAVAVVLVGLVAVVVALPEIRNQAQAQMDLLANPSEVEAATVRWQQEFAPFTGSAQDFLRIAEEAHALDTPKGYGRARDALKKALILAPDDPQALASYIENEAVGFRDRMAPATRGELLGWLEDLRDEQGAARRAEALLTVDAGRRRALVLALSRSAAAADRVTAAELLAAEAPEDALRALELESPPLRAVRARAAAQAHRGQVATAVRTVAARRRSEPSNRLLLALEGGLLVKAGAHRQAERRLAQALRASPEHMLTALQYGEVAADVGLTAEAASSLQLVAERETAPPELRARAYLEWARLAAAQTAWPIAEQRAAAALELSPANPTAATVLAESLVQEGKPLAAEAALEPHLQPPAPAVSVLAATLALQHGRPEAATSHIEAARNAAPHDPRLAIIAAAITRAAGDDARAKVHAEHLLALDPDYLAHHDEVIDIMPSSLQTTQETLRRDPRPRARALAAALRCLAGDPDRARSSLRGLDEEPIAALYNAHLSLARGALETARRHLRHLDPSPPTAQLLRARRSARRRAMAEAKAEYAEAAASPGLARAAAVERAALEKDPTPLRDALAEHPDDPWLRAKLFARGD